mmetsp:Transcript_9993/g.15041  ORF Transcript_9993/g.15041 Transcript_9993/m.15041 type:complete len:116 (-) Transcript_9993:43-390(-)
MNFFLLLVAVICSSLINGFSMSSFHGAQIRSRAASANGLKMEIEVEIGEDESVESALMRFKRAVAQSGHLQELKYRTHFENSQEKKKRKMANARRQNKLARMNDRKFAGDMQNNR